MTCLADSVPLFTCKSASTASTLKTFLAVLKQRIERRSQSDLNLDRREVLDLIRSLRRPKSFATVFSEEELPWTSNHGDFESSDEMIEGAEFEAATEEGKIEEESAADKIEEKKEE